MTAYATRSPLQLLSVPHMMNDSRHSSRRTSARLADKESVPLAKGIDHTVDEVIRTTEKYGAGSKQAIPRTNGAVVNSVGGRVKRKHGMYNSQSDTLRRGIEEMPRPRLRLSVAKALRKRCAIC